MIDLDEVKEQEWLLDSKDFLVKELLIDIISGPSIVKGARFAYSLIFSGIWGTKTELVFDEPESLTVGLCVDGIKNKDLYYKIGEYKQSQLVDIRTLKTEDRNSFIILEIRRPGTTMAERIYIKNPTAASLVLYYD